MNTDFFRSCDSMENTEKSLTGHIVLIGMPGSGKSTVGVVLSKMLGHDLVDTDLVIQHRTGRRLYELIEKEGMDGFLELEGRITAEVGPFETGTVIATGGSVVYSREAMEHFRRIGKVVYLHVPYDILERRLGDLHERGIAMRSGQSLQELYRERAGLYEMYADLCIREGDNPLEEVLRMIRTELCSS